MFCIWTKKIDSYLNFRQLAFYLLFLFHNFLNAALKQTNTTCKIGTVFINKNYFEANFLLLRYDTIT